MLCFSTDVYFKCLSTWSLWTPVEVDGFHTEWNCFRAVETRLCVFIPTFMWITKCHHGLHGHRGEWKMGEVSINFGYAIYLIPQQITLQQNQMP